MKFILKTHVQGKDMYLAMHTNQGIVGMVSSRERAVELSQSDAEHERNILSEEPFKMVFELKRVDDGPKKNYTVELVNPKVGAVRYLNPDNSYVSQIYQAEGQSLSTANVTAMKVNNAMREVREKIGRLGLSPLVVWYASVVPKGGHEDDTVQSSKE